ncbi:oligopeptide/dipeptide ABC transporter ATP-binding protein [Segeticoccus sp.]|uniref:oligopeptide/dipeptide ABC transporter ATP-binding protein n=1 Tax=Segeticoccus sp. TaxID=2706531 RepID=UPI002D7E1D6D|nr:oligopeptide/dipeptide ABC transporter ATP-binding protein [Segeticoccus sp.]
MNDVSLTVTEGSVVGIVGESGSGKSTLGYCLSGYLRPTSGSVTVLGEPLTWSRRTRSVPKVQMAFQDAFESLDPRWTIGESLREAAAASGASEQDIADAVESMGMRTDILDQHPSDLSPGYQKVINLVRAVVAGARVIVADEPTSGLDLRSRRLMAGALRTLARNSGISLLLISHDLPFIQHLADTIYVMYLGDVVEQGDKSRVFSHPMHPYARALVAASLREESVKLAGEIPSPTDRPKGCPLAGRCPFAEARCWAEEQRLLGGSDHQWACWKAEDIDKEIRSREEEGVKSA